VEEQKVKIVILGCSRVGSTIANTMSKDGHDVTILDQNPDSFRRLSNDYQGKKVVGNGTNEDTLRKADLEHADAFVATTNGDNRNIMSVQIAKLRFSVPMVIARIYDPIRASAYAEMGVRTFCSTCVAAGAMQDMILGRPFQTMDDYCAPQASSTGMEIDNDH